LPNHREQEPFSVRHHRGCAVTPSRFPVWSGGSSLPELNFAVYSELQGVALDSNLFATDSFCRPAPLGPLDSRLDVSLELPGPARTARPRQQATTKQRCGRRLRQSLTNNEESLFKHSGAT